MSTLGLFDSGKGKSGAGANMIVNQVEKKPPRRPMEPLVKWALFAVAVVLASTVFVRYATEWDADAIHTQDEQAEREEQRDQPEWYPIELRIQWATLMQGKDYDRSMTTRPEPPDLRLSLQAWCKEGSHSVERCKNVQDGKPFLIGEKNPGYCFGKYGKFAHTYTIVYANRKESGAVQDSFCVGDNQPNLDFWTHYSMKWQGWGRYELRVDWQSGDVNSCGSWNYWNCKVWMYKSDAKTYSFELKKGGNF